MNHLKFNQVLLQLLLLYQMEFHCLTKFIHPLVPGMQLLIWKMLFFSAYTSLRPQKAIYFQQYNFICTVLPLGVYSSLVLYHYLVMRNLDCLCFLQDITLVYYIDDIMLTGPCEQEIRTNQHIAKEFVFQKVRNKFDKNVETFYLIETSSDPGL